MQRVFAMKKLKLKPGMENFDIHNEYFTREMEIHSTIKHPFIVNYKDHF
jgi:hypothetical protein